MNRAAVIAVVLVIAAVGAVALWYWTGAETVEAPEPEEPATPAPESPAEGDEEGEDLRGDLPPLDRSDSAVRSRGRDLSNHPLWDEALSSENLVRRIVATVDAVARGNSPRASLGFLDPEEPFEVVERNDRLFIAESSYARYDPVADAIASLDTDAAVIRYRRMRPLFEEAYDELGVPEGSFQETLRVAIDRLLSTPLPDGPVEVVPDIVGHDYADPDLQALSEADKHLLRMGPDNARKVRGKLREFRQILFGSP